MMLSWKSLCVYTRTKTEYTMKLKTPKRLERKEKFAHFYALRIKGIQSVISKLSTNTSPPYYRVRDGTRIVVFFS